MFPIGTCIARPFEGEPEPADAAEGGDETERAHLSPALSPERRGRSFGLGAVGWGGFLHPRGGARLRRALFAARGGASGASFLGRP
jgi:hypothetical protein